MEGELKLKEASASVGARLSSGKSATGSSKSATERWSALHFKLFTSGHLRWYEQQMVIGPNQLNVSTPPKPKGLVTLRECKIYHPKRPHPGRPYALCIALRVDPAAMEETHLLTIDPGTEAERAKWQQALERMRLAAAWHNDDYPKPLECWELEEKGEALTQAIEVARTCGGVGSKEHTLEMKRAEEQLKMAVNDVQKARRSSMLFNRKSHSDSATTPSYSDIECPFTFIRAEKLLEAERSQELPKKMPRLQELEQKWPLWLVTKKLQHSDMVNQGLSETILVVSHRWEHPHHPEGCDEEVGCQLEAILKALKNINEQRRKDGRKQI